MNIDPQFIIFYLLFTAFTAFLGKGNIPFFLGFILSTLLTPMGYMIIQLTTHRIQTGPSQPIGRGVQRREYDYKKEAQAKILHEKITSGELSYSVWDAVMEGYLPFKTNKPSENACRTAFHMYKVKA